MSQAITEFRRFSPVKKAAVVAITAWNLTLLVIAERDLQRRAPSEVRGSKNLWRAACLLNTVGPLSYLRWGRR